MKDFHASDFVTEQEAKYAEYEVDDAKGTKMGLTTSSGPGWSLVFGKAAKSGGSYVRDAKACSGLQALDGMRRSGWGVNVVAAAKPLGSIGGAKI